MTAKSIQLQTVIPILDKLKRPKTGGEALEL